MFALPKPGAVGDVDGGRGRPDVGERDLDRADRRRHADLVPDHAVRRHDRAGAHERRGARHDSKKIVGLTTGTTYRFTVQAINDSGGGPASAQSNAVTPTRADRAGRADRRGRAAGDEVGARELDGAGRDDGDSAITGYTITPYVGGAAQDPVEVARVGHEQDDHRARRTAPRTRSASRRPTASARAPTRPPRARGDAAATRCSSFATPGTVDSGDAGARRARRQVPRRPRRDGHRRALLQGGGQHRHAHRQPVDGDRARASRRRRSPTRARPGGRRRRSRRPVDADRRDRRTWRRTTRRTATTR